MNKYRLKVGAGAHREDGKTYRGGDTIETHRDLATAFPNKFELVHESKGKGGKKGAEETVEDEGGLVQDDTQLVGTKVMDIPATQKATGKGSLNTRGGVRTAKTAPNSTTKAPAGKSKGKKDEAPSDDEFA